MKSIINNICHLCPVRENNYFLSILYSFFYKFFHSIKFSRFFNCRRKNTCITSSLSHSDKFSERISSHLNLVDIHFNSICYLFVNLFLLRCHFHILCNMCLFRKVKHISFQSAEHDAVKLFTEFIEITITSYFVSTISTEFSVMMFELIEAMLLISKPFENDK